MDITSEAERILKDYYHIDTSKYESEIIQDDDITVTVCFKSKYSGNRVYVECYYTETEILQSTVYL